MTTAIKRRRGTTAQHATFTGLEAELTVDTTKDTVVVHDGATAGGIPLLREDLSNNTAVVKNNVSNTFSTSQIISANTSSDALRITQTGTGNALVVEDSANPDATPFVVDANGNIASGLTNPSAYLGSSQVGQILKSSTAFGPQTWIWNAVNDTSAGYAIFQKDRAGAIVQSGDSLANIEIKGYDGVAYIPAARITSQVDGTPGANDMPGRLVFSTTRDGASSPTEAMRIDSNQNIGFGGGSVATVKVGISGTLAQSGGTGLGFVNYGTIPSGTTSLYQSFRSVVNTQAASFTLSTLASYYAGQGAVGAGSAVTNQMGFFAEALTGATNNYGFYSAIASGTGRYNFYAAGTADNYFAGKVGVGAAPPVAGVDLFQSGGQLTAAITTNTNIEPFFVAKQNSANAGAGGGIIFGAQNGSFAAIKGLLTNGLGNTVGDLAFSTRNATGDSTLTERMRITSAGNTLFGRTYSGGERIGIGGGTSTLTSGTSAVGILNDTIVSSTQTVSYSANNTYLSTQATAFTLTTLTHFQANQNAFGAGSTVTNQYGFNASGALTGATNNYGFFSSIASGTGRYNFYAAGTADNYFAGKVITGSDSIQVNTAKTPASATATGTTGQIAWDANYVYVCVATNTWKRTAIATW